MQRLKARFCTASAWDVFINHNGADTKRNVAGLLHDDLAADGIRAFLDCSSMKPGDKLTEKIEEAIDECRVGIVVLSPRFCHSYYCLHELALLVEANKKLIPIFFDIQPSQLMVMLDAVNAKYSDRDLHRFDNALREARFTVGITFDSSKGNWSKLVRKVSEAVHTNLEAMEEESRERQIVMKAKVPVNKFGFLPFPSRSLSKQYSLDPDVDSWID